MRIGILTFHRAHNYGAVLQCYALQEYLVNLGHNVSVIDYNNSKLWKGYEWRDRKYEKWMLKNPIKLPIRFFRYIKGRKRQFVRYNKFVRFQERKLRLSNVDSIQQKPYDLILIGSDQIWNTSITNGLDPYYWGTFEKPIKTKVATYGASLREFWKEDQYDAIYEALKKLDGISVREYAVGEYVKKIFPDLNVFCVPDPVLLLSAKQWKALAKSPSIKYPYIFFYQAQESKVVYEEAVKIASQKKLPLLCLSAGQWALNSEKCHSASPQEFLGWILNAKLVITSSFHAMAFCIIFEKDFYCINLNMGHDERLKNLVSKFSLEDRLIDNYMQCKNLQPFSSVNELSLVREEADNYLSFLQNGID